MLTTILSLAGLGGFGALLWFFPALRAFLKLVPWWVWVGAGLIAFGTWWHLKEVREAQAEAIAATDAKWKSAFDTMHKAATDWKAAYTTSQILLATERRLTHEKELGRIAAAADALRLHGPGRASAGRCGPGNGAVASTAAGGREPAPAGPDAPGPGVPAEDRAIVSWPWLVKRGEEFDQLLDEVKTWRAHDAEQRALFEKWKLELPKPEFGPPPAD